MTAAPHLVEQLFEQIASVEPYPPGVLRMPDEANGRPRLPGIAFFPGGTGLWMGGGISPPSVFPVGGIMLIAHNFGTEVGYKKIKKLMEQGPCDPCSRNPATWGRLIQFLRRFSISLERCFFTNAFMGLIQEGDTDVGKFPGARDKNFVVRCRNFLSVQLAMHQPRLVLTLGANVPAIVAPLAPQLKHWKGITTRVFDSLDAAGAAVHDVLFGGVESTTASVVALVHPSYRPSTVSRRRYAKLQGDEAEVAMVREALQHSGMG